MHRVNERGGAIRHDVESVSPATGWARLAATATVVWGYLIARVSGHDLSDRPERRLVRQAGKNSPRIAVDKKQIYSYGQCTRLHDTTAMLNHGSGPTHYSIPVAQPAMKAGHRSAGHRSCGNGCKQLSRCRLRAVPGFSRRDLVRVNSPIVDDWEACTVARSLSIVAKNEGCGMQH